MRLNGLVTSVANTDLRSVATSELTRRAHDRPSTAAHPAAVPQSLVPFGEDLKNVPVGPSHGVANASDLVGWNVLVKEVAHRVDEDLPRAPPVQRLIELFRNQSEIGALLEPTNPAERKCSSFPFQGRAAGFRSPTKGAPILDGGGTAARSSIWAHALR